VPSAAVPDPAVPSAARRAPRAAIIIAAVVVLALAGGLTWYFTVGRSPSALQAGIAAYDAGQREKARGELTQAVRQDPSLSLPHVYLGRIAREEGDFGTAGTELAAAVRNDTSSALARRELASFFLARGQQVAAQGRPDLAAADFDAARRHYVRAIQLDPSDRSAQGFLGCTLARLGRAQEAASWIARAGQGPWTSCASAAPPTSPAAATGAARPHGS
jgi:tetratricopeptide (TPR) repeat protein